MLDINNMILNDKVNEMLLSKRRKNMLLGDKYYAGEHDIFNKKLNKYVIYDQLSGANIEKTNENKANHKISHKFHKKLVDQKRNYICAKPLTLTYVSPGTETEKTKENSAKIMEKVWNLLGIKFDSLPTKIVKEISNKGEAWIHPTYDKDGQFILKKIRSEEIIPIYDTETEEELVSVIHFYFVEEITENNKKKEKIYVEWWDSETVTYFVQEKNGEISNYVLDTTRANPCPHFYRNIIEATKGEIIRVENHSWGRVPFIQIKNNEEGSTDLEPIKELIDAYDLINSNFVNTVEDAKELIYKISGYGAEDMLQFIENIKVNGVIRNNDSSGSIAIEKIEIPYEARQALLRLIKQLIYEFGRGVDTSNPDLIGQAPSGVALSFLYSDLDLKADDCIIYLKEGLYEILWYVVEHFKKNNDTDFKNINNFDFKIDFNKSRIFNELELVQALSNDTVLSEQTKLSKHPFVEDVAKELDFKTKEKETKMKDMIKAGGYDSTI